LTILAVVLAVTAAACSGGTQDVARVGDDTITMDDISDLFESSSIPAGEEFRTVLFRLMAVEALTDAYESEFGATVDDASVEELYMTYMDQLEQSGQTVGDVLGVADASDEMMRFNAYLGVMQQSVIESLAASPENLDLIYNDGLSVTEVCVRHILTTTADELTAAAERIEGGEEFAAVADELSLDTGTPGGDLGCSEASRYVEPFARAAVEATIGELTYPVETQFGFHAIVVDDRTVLATYDDVAADPLSYLTDADANTLWTGWFNEVLQAADSEVLDPDRYGTWSPVGIVPPEEG
jgi:parvulin-like peptidyl-prolyl isomerase